MLAEGFGRVYRARHGRIVVSEAVSCVARQDLRNGIANFLTILTGRENLPFAVIGAMAFRLLFSI